MKGNVVSSPAQIPVNGPGKKTWDVVFSASAVQTLREHFARAEGCEVCGFLFAKPSESGVYVESAQPATNIYGAKESFAISQGEYAAALRNSGGETHLAGIYHTHSGPARPSFQDRRAIVLSAHFWLIVGHTGEVQQEWRCFAQRRGKVRELSMSGIE